MSPVGLPHELNAVVASETLEDVCGFVVGTVIYDDHHEMDPGVQKHGAPGSYHGGDAVRLVVHGHDQGEIVPVSSR